MGYVQIEELTRELDRENDEASVFRENVPCGASMRFEFVADAPIEFYIKNKEYLKKDKHVEQYIKMKEEGKLEEYISKNA